MFTSPSTWITGESRGEEARVHLPCSCFVSVRLLIAFHKLHVLWYSYYSYSVDGEMEALRVVVQGEAALSLVSLSPEPSLQKFRLFYSIPSDPYPFFFPCPVLAVKLIAFWAWLDFIPSVSFFFLNYILNRSHNYVALLSRGCGLPPTLPAGHGHVQVRTRGGRWWRNPHSPVAFDCEGVDFAFSDVCIPCFLFICAKMVSFR